MNMFLIGFFSFPLLICACMLLWIPLRKLFMTKEEIMNEVIKENQKRLADSYKDFR